MANSSGTLPALVPTRARADGWTPEKQRAFLENLSASGSVSAAARSVGMSRESAYSLRRRAEGRGFAQAWDAARLLATEHLVEVAWDRALNGVVRPIYYHGELVGEVVHHDSRLLLGLIAQNRQLAARQEGGSALASGAVVEAVLGDWDAALERVERGEALDEAVFLPDTGDSQRAHGASGTSEAGGEAQAAGGTSHAGHVPLHHPADGSPPRAGEEGIPPALPAEFDHRGDPLSEAQVLDVGTYAIWWEDGLECWLTNWPAPEGWTGKLYVTDVLDEPEEVSPDDEEIDEDECSRTLSPEEAAGLERVAADKEAARAARLELYRRAHFGLARPAELAAIAAVNGGRTDWVVLEP